MTISVVACGPTAEGWHNTPCDLSIGCNDAAKWGQKLDSLVVCNRPQQFSKERYEIIKNTKCENFYSHKSAWVKEFPAWKKINLTPWYGTYHKGQIYSSNSSPIIAITLAAKLGAKEIIMWGVDMVSHHIFSTSNPQTKKEVEVYLQIYDALKANGIRLWLGSYGTALDKYVPLWKD